MRLMGPVRLEPAEDNLHVPGHCIRSGGRAVVHCVRRTHKGVPKRVEKEMETHPFGRSIARTPGNGVVRNGNPAPAIGGEILLGISFDFWAGTTYPPPPDISPVSCRFQRHSHGESAKKSPNAGRLLTDRWTTPSTAALSACTKGDAVGPLPAVEHGRL